MMFTRKTVLLSLLFSCLSINALASDASAGGEMAINENVVKLDTPRKNMRISINPAEMLTATIPLNFDFAVSNRVSLGINAFGQFFSFNEAARILGGGGGLSAKFHLSNDVNSDGWYIKPVIEAGYTKIETDPSKSNAVKGKYFSFGGGLRAGYDWVWESGFSIGLGLGMGYKHIFAEASQANSLKELPFGMRGILPSGEFTLGWVF